MLKLFGCLGLNGFDFKVMWLCLYLGLFDCVSFFICLCWVFVGIVCYWFNWLFCGVWMLALDRGCLVCVCYLILFVWFIGYLLVYVWFGLGFVFGFICVCWRLCVLTLFVAWLLHFVCLLFLVICYGCMVLIELLIVWILCCLKFCRLLSFRELCWFSVLR